MAESIANQRLLLLSNSRNYGEGYLTHAEPHIKHFLGKDIEKVLFIPFAGVRFSYDDYTQMVRTRMTEMGYQLISIHETADAQEAIANAQAIVIGGGNTFHLLYQLQTQILLDAIRSRVAEGMPFIGWSAGSNVACPTIRTTNDMPIIEPTSFNALGLVPFQINPHYTDAVIPNHQGETRAERLAEFLELNSHTYVVGLREGSGLQVEGKSIKLLGDKTVRIFSKGAKGQQVQELTAKESLDFLFEPPR